MSQSELAKPSIDVEYYNYSMYLYSDINFTLYDACLNSDEKIMQDIIKDFKEKFNGVEFKSYIKNMLIDSIKKYDSIP